MWFNLALYLKRGPSGGEYNGGGGATSAAAIEPCLLEVDSWIDSRKQLYDTLSELIIHNNIKLK